MKFSLLNILAFSIVSISSCVQKSEKEATNYHSYFDKSVTDTIAQEALMVVSDEEYLQYGSRVAYLNTKGDTIIPFSKYGYLGTDTMTYYANVIEFSKDSSYGRWVAIDRNLKTLYEIVPFDGGPDYFHEGLVRVKRNGKMGFADKYGQIVIPCKYDFVWWFENGKAKVTFDAIEIKNKYDGHTRIESDQWFYIDKNGKKIKN